MSRTTKNTLAVLLAAVVTTAAVAGDGGSMLRLAQNGRGAGVEVTALGGSRRTFVIRSAADFARADALSSASSQAAINYTCQPSTSGFCINDFPAMCGERGAQSSDDLPRASTCSTAGASGGRPQPIAASDQSPLR